MVLHNSVMKTYSFHFRVSILLLVKWCTLGKIIFLAVLTEKWCNEIFRRENQMNYMLSIATAVLAGLLLTRLSNRFKLPDVTSYLIAGVLLGPCVLGLLGIPASASTPLKMSKPSHCTMMPLWDSSPLPSAVNSDSPIFARRENRLSSSVCCRLSSPHCL